jgi:5-methyltetrahydropteroyltriglutamate--homocysteine methyltransferase
MLEKMFTTVIGSYPLSYQQLGKDAITRSVKDQLDAGIWLVSDGQTRYDMVEYFARAIDGYSYNNKSIIAEKIGGGNSEELLNDLKIAKAIAPHCKGIITGPITLVFSSKIKSYYKGFSDKQVYLDTAKALLDIAIDLQDCGAEWIQIDEPFLSVGAPMNIAREAIESIALQLQVPVALHVCGVVTKIFKELLQWEGITMLSHAFMGDNNLEILEMDELQRSNKIIGLGCVDTKTTEVEEIADIERLITKALEKLPADRLVIHPDCGLKMLPHDVAFEKLKRMVLATNRISQPI